MTFATLDLFLAVGAIGKFSTEGEGTLAPWETRPATGSARFLPIRAQPDGQWCP